jgi:II/X family phage/plasmid replication protein
VIDWITALIPFAHTEPFNNGQVISIDRDGVQEWITNKRLAVRGSYESTIHIKSDSRTWCPETGLYTHILFDGNPVKFFQGHNLWGSNDLIGLMSEIMLTISDLLKHPMTASNWHFITQGMYELKRVDSTRMISLGTQADVKAFLYSAERTAHMRYKGQGIMTGNTLYFGKHSRRESLKMYSKLVEISAKGHQLPLKLQALPELYKWVDDKLRLEVCTRSLELKDRGLNLAANWGDNTPDEVLDKSLSGLNMSENHTISPTALNGLPARLVAVYHLWKEGHDLKAMYPPTTYKRYRKAMKEAAGIDIAVKQGNRPEPNPNVIEFKRVLYPERVEQVPAWAIGTPLYFEPRALVG